VPNAIVDGPFGSNLKLNDYVNEGVPVLQGKNITNDSFRWFDVRFISHRKASELKRSSVRVGDVLIVKIGSIGFSAVVDNLNGFDFAIIPANLAKVTPDATKIDLGYLRKWLTSVDAKRYLVGAASKTAQPALSLGKIRNLPLPLPPLAEQRRIAEVLDRAEALRAKRRAALAELDSLTQSLFLDLFGDPLSNTRELPVKCLSDLVDPERPITYGILKPGEYSSDGVPMLRIQDIKDGKICESNLHRVSRELSAQYARTLLRGGEIVISLVGTIGLVAAIPQGLAGANLHRNLGMIVPNGRVDATYLQQFLTLPYFLQSIRKQLKGGNQQLLNLGELGVAPVLLPPLECQREFARRVGAVEKLKTAQRASLAELDALFASLQHRAFRGEL